MVFPIATWHGTYRLEIQGTLLISDTLKIVSGNMRLCIETYLLV